MKNFPHLFPMFSRWIRTFFLVISTTVVVVAARADLLTLQNGDHISGEVEKFVDGKLIFKTEWGGSIQVSWSSVDVLESDMTFSVMTTEGEVYSGSLHKAKSSLSVTTDQRTNTLEAAKVVSISPTGRSIWDRIDGAFNLGYSMVRGSSNTTQSALSTNVHYEQPKYRIQGSVLSTLNEPEEGQATSRHTLDARYDRFLSNKSFVFMLSGLERNEQQLLNLRTKFGGGLARKLINTKKTTLSLLGGINFANEQYRFGGGIALPATTRGEGLAVFDFRTIKLARVELTLRIALHPTLSGYNRYRIESDGGLRIPITKNFMWGVSLYDRFDSRPPVPVQRNDYGLLSTLGYKF